MCNHGQEVRLFMFIADAEVAALNIFNVGTNAFVGVKNAVENAGHGCYLWFWCEGERIAPHVSNIGGRAARVKPVNLT